VSGSGKVIPFFRGTTGINTVADPVRVPHDLETGIMDLAEGINVSVDQTLRPNLRKGRKLLYAGDFHTIFHQDTICLLVGTEGSTDSLFILGTDMVPVGIRSGLTRGARMSFTEIDGQVFYANGFENGVVYGGLSHSWPADEYFGTETTRSFTGPPIGHHICWAFSRMFVARRNELWRSEEFRPGLFDRARGFYRFESELLMVKPVDAGLFVSDEHNTYFLAGGDPEGFAEKKVADFPAIEWADALQYVEGSELGIEGVSPGPAALWASPEGAMLGSSSGQLINLNKRKVIYPENCRTGAGLLMGYNFIHSMG